MENIEKYIVSLDLGSSKIALTVATLNGKDLQVIYHKDAPSHGIKYSSVGNIRHVSDIIKSLIKNAEDELGLSINQVVVGMPRYPIRLVSNEAEIKGRGEDSEITEEDIKGLKKIVQDYKLENEEKEIVYGCVTQSYSDGENFGCLEDEIIGMMSDTVKGHFKIFIGKRKELKTIDSALTKAGIASRMKYFTAETTAKAVLTPSEMENGVALIDFGGGCASVTVYYGNIMRHYASIPFGGKNITDDIKTELQLNERLAENIKLGFGACMPGRLQSMSEKKLHIHSKTGDAKTEVPIKYLAEIINARIEEIIYALLYEIENSGTSDYIRSGIVVTGGVAQTANIATLISEMSGCVTRIGYPSRNISCQGLELLRDTGCVTSLGLIMAAAEEESINCAVFNDSPKIEIVIEENEPADTHEDAVISEEEGISEEAGTSEEAGISEGKEEDEAEVKEETAGGDEEDKEEMEETEEEKKEEEKEEEKKPEEKESLFDRFREWADRITKENV